MIDDEEAISSEFTEKIKKVEKCWVKIFKQLDVINQIDRDGFFCIEAEKIKEISGEEPRLMTKFDHKDDLPSIFKNNKLSILPIERGNYIIGKFSTHFVIKNKRLERIEKPQSNLECLQLENLTSESMALNYALNSGILENVLGEECYQAISGRMKSGKFSFYIKDSQTGEKRKIDIKNSQLEIDGGYEGDNKIMIIEAKKGACNDFIIRQLYYPYRLRKNKVEKTIVPVFMTYSSGIFSFFIFRFEEEDNYNSIKLIEQKDFIIKFEPILTKEVKNILKSIKIEDEPEVPFPQADNFRRCIDFIESLKNGNKNTDEIALDYNFTYRQAGYYSNAAKYLGLAQNIGRGEFSLTTRGKNLVNLDRRDMILEFIKKILSHKVFNETFRQTLELGKIPKNSEIAKIMKTANLYHVKKESTYVRRASTVRGRIAWILDMTEEDEY